MITVDTIEVSRSGVYAWNQDGTGARHIVLLGAIEAWEFQESDGAVATRGNEPLFAQILTLYTGRGSWQFRTLYSGNGGADEGTAWLADQTLYDLLMREGATV